MGMLDQPKVWGDNFKEGQVFTLEAARVGPEINTDYGVSAPALLKINGEWYSVFGKALVNQVERLERGELPHDVAIVRQQTRAGQPVKVIVPKEKLQDDDIPF